MVKKNHASSEQTHASNPEVFGGTPANEPADIIEQLRTENEELRGQIRELQESKGRDERAIRGWEWLARIADENPDPVMQVSLDGVIQYRNFASFPLCRQWSPHDELVVPAVVCQIVNEAHARTQVIRYEMTVGEQTYLLTVAPAPPAAKYVNVYARDITARKRAEEALRELNNTLEKKVADRTQELEHRTRELEHRTGELEHRTRQLQKLTLELAQTEERERKRMAEILHDDLQQILAAAKFHLSRMLNRIKPDASLQALGGQIDAMLKEAIEKSRSLSHELSPAVLHHGDLTETLGWLANQIKTKHGLVVHVHASGKVNLQSDTIVALLYRTAQELLFNVVKHARTKEASMRVRQHRQCVCLSVSDHGRGFDPQGLQEASGYGLLSIRERIELLGGRMRIRSTEGKGSTVVVMVPDHQPAGAALGAQTKWNGPTTEAGSPPQENHGRLRVLLADDHKIVREGLRSLLRDEADIEIMGEAAHGREAADLAMRLEPDVVIMDVSMPLIDGDVATRQIKEHRPQTRVIALSTYNEPEKIERMFRAGAEGYVLKTASSQELLAVIRGRKVEIEGRLTVPT